MHYPDQTSEIEQIRMHSRETNTLDDAGSTIFRREESKSPEKNVSLLSMTLDRRREGSEMSFGNNSFNLDEVSL